MSEPTTASTSATLRRRGSAGLVVLLAASLVGASALRGVITKKYGPERDAVAAAGTGSVGGFNSYTLGLLLGGLRGPLVMTLWSSSETQKGERNLDDINTKIELIGLLQPEFDAVHLFQIWNKAYNLSVQMSNLPSKYATILDALAYADHRRDENPVPNLNLESAVAGIYFDKLGGSAEKAYYRLRVREETRQPIGQTKFVFPESRRAEFIRAALAAGADGRRYSIRPESGEAGRLTARLSDDYAPAVKASFTGADVSTTSYAPRDPNRTVRSAMRTMLTPVLDAQGKLLEEYASHKRPADLDDAQWHPEYGELQYLTRFEPFPYGISPYALGYNYYKRSVALQVSLNQKHAQLSDRVISSRPGLALKSWAEEEIELGRMAEMSQFGLSPMKESESPLPNEMPATVIPTDRVALTPLLKEAIYSYQRAVDVGTRSMDEFKQHAGRYSDDVSTYRVQSADIVAKVALAKGDALFLQAITAPDDASRSALAKQAIDAYQLAIDLMNRNVLAWFIPDELIPLTFPKGYGKLDATNSFDNAAAFPRELLEPTVQRSMQAGMQANIAIGSEVGEYLTYSDRARVRMQKLSAIAK